FANYCSFIFSLTVFYPTDVYTLSLHDALPILHFEKTDEIVFFDKAEEIINSWINYSKSEEVHKMVWYDHTTANRTQVLIHYLSIDRKSTRLNSSHVSISYAVFCLKNKILS